MSDKKVTYERIRPLIVWLGLIELAWIGYWLLSGDNKTATFVGITVTWIVAMLGWLALVIHSGSRGFFLKLSWALSNLVGVGIVVMFAATVFFLIPNAWLGVLSAARTTSDSQLIAIHILRLLAIGTVVKFIHGELPLHFVILGSLPDFLFAVSALVLVVVGTSGLPDSLLVAWHVIGFSLFLGAGVSMFFSVPSPLRMYHSKPDASLVFQFPMVLAPNFTVPLFMIAHLFALSKLMVP